MRSLMMRNHHQQMKAYHPRRHRWRNNISIRGMVNREYVVNESNIKKQRRESRAPSARHALWGQW